MPADLRVQRLLESTKAVPWEADARTWQFSYVGPQAERLLGYPPEAWYGQDFWSAHMHSDDRKSALSFCLEQSRCATDYEFQYRMVAKDGRSVWIHDVVHVESVGGVPRTLAGFMIDITTQKEAEANANATNAMFRGILEAAPDAMVVSDEPGRITFINAQTARLFGHSSKELIGTRVETLMPERFRRSHIGHRAGYASARQVRTMGSALALFGLRKDGSEFPVEISLSPLTVDGQALVISAIRDVTERRRTVAETVELKSRYEDLYENAPDIYLSTAADTAKLIQCNETAVRTLGYSREELIGRPVLSLYHPDCIRHARQLFRSFLGIGEVKDVELCVVCKDGTTLDVSINVSAMRDADGRIVASRSVMRDITRRKQAEREAQERFDQLAHASRVSTMGELTASLAHELRQPLTAILSNAQAAERFLAEEPPSVHELREILADIIRDNRRAGKVIRRLRDLFSSGTTAKAELLNLNQVVADVLPLLRSDAIIRRLTITTEFDARLPSVRSDRVQLQQVILNLLLNAAEAMKDCRSEDRMIVLRTACHNPKRVVVSIEDCGVGVTEENLEQLFTPFYTTKAQGMGMGLSIARSILQQHDGRLWATRNPNRGATFSFALPVAKSREA